MFAPLKAPHLSIITQFTYFEQNCRELIIFCIKAYNTEMKLALTLVIAAVFLPCLQAFDLGSHPDDDVLGEWLKEHNMAKSQSSNELVSYYVCVKVMV